MARATAQEFKMGQNVTEYAKSEGRGTVVMSLRLAVQEFLALNRLAEQEGKTVSQLAREGIRARIRGQADNWNVLVSVTLSMKGGDEASFGVRRQTTTNPLHVEVRRDSYETLTGSGILAVA